MQNCYMVVNYDLKKKKKKKGMFSIDLVRSLTCLIAPKLEIIYKKEFLFWKPKLEAHCHCIISTK